MAAAVGIWLGLSGAIAGRQRRLSDLVLLAVGVFVVAAGVVTGILGP